MIWILLILLQGQLDSAQKYLYVREARPNRSVEIDRWNRYVGNALGSPYCSAFACAMVAKPQYKTGLATKLIRPHSIKADDVLKGAKVIPGSFVVWRKGATIFGHAGLVIAWDRSRGKTIEANTSSGVKGSQSDGDGVYIRQRKIEPFNFFRIVAFTEAK